jgi:hypothetical protein
VALRGGYAVALGEPGNPFAKPHNRTCSFRSRNEGILDLVHAAALVCIDEVDSRCRYLDQQLSGTGNGALNRYISEDFWTTGLPGDNGVRHGFLPRAGVSLPGPPILGFKDGAGPYCRSSVSLAAAANTRMHKYRT